ncbi:dihydrolipoamide acetyltransferase family protein [Anoxynatronum buryatiense]|uniref:Dihydrolipoamide acetyltransferase component of pyruvate dehydrogenase complex n=1 Tax=Anoxynatronum buryatiense TaxID=489973 RepID=A0AA45WXC8_9CLOT|nr:dihydrolipoamide acetyltransferase family protein [Anoxynatronum buryatiense]SMP63888.1 2-oxoglutarate dehydrogenase E2 component [Anoxynatronum buryatiense]
MPIEIHMPKLGMTMKEGTLVKWLKSEGDGVKKGEPIAEITSEKISNEIEAPADGVLNKPIVKEGDVVGIGAILAYISESSDDIAVIKEQLIEILDEPKIHQIHHDKTILQQKPLSSLRQIIGERMSESLQRSPQGTMTTRADMSGLIRLRELYAEQGHRVSLTDIFVKIAGLALEKHRLLNSTIVENDLIIYESINIGIAVGTEEGLYVPVIKNVASKGLLEISLESKQLIQQIMDKKITSAHMTGGTFTISNLGMFDVDVITPIINPPEAAILAIGTTRKEVVVLENDATVILPLTTLSLTADHAIIDGLPAVSFLASLKEMMTNVHQYID